MLFRQTCYNESNFLTALIALHRLSTEELSRMIGKGILPKTEFLLTFAVDPGASDFANKAVGFKGGGTLDEVPELPG